MSIIEQATKRLEELRQAGIAVPWDGTIEGAAPAVPAPSQPPGLADPRNAQPKAPLQARRSRSIELPITALGAAGLLVPGQPRSALADEFRVVKRPLLQNAQPEPGTEPIHRGNLILVTSAMPGEGKTFTAINLALSIAMEVDKTVLLVDADVVRPTLMTRLGVQERQPGLLDVLTGACEDLSEVLLRTNIPKLTLLPAGSPCHNATELLASDAMERLLDELATKYSDRIVVFDTPPLLPTTESRVLAARAGQVVMVVEADKTSRSTATRAFAAVENCPIVMSVLNKCRGMVATDRYGYY